MEYVRFIGFIVTSMAIYILAKDVFLNWSRDETVESVSEDSSDKEFVDKVEPEDELANLDGIDNKMLDDLARANIVTYSDLELADENEVKDAISANHPEVTVSEIKLWIRQASLAEQERWDELDRLKEAMQKARAKRN